MTNITKYLNKTILFKLADNWIPVKLCKYISTTNELVIEVDEHLTMMVENTSSIVKPME